MDDPNQGNDGAVEENQVFVPDPPAKIEPDNITEEALRENGMSEEEIAIAKDQGMISEPKKDGEDGKKAEEPPKPAEPKKDEEKEDGKDSKEPQKKDALDVEALDSFEKVHELYEKSPEKFRNLPKNVKALYHNSKGLYKKAKTEEQRRHELERKSEFEKVRNKGAEMRLDKVKEILKKDDLTIEDIEKVLDEGQVAVDNALNKAKETDDDTDDEQKAEQMARDRLIEANKLGQTEYGNFAGIIRMAEAVMAEKPRYQKMRYQKMLDDVLVDENATEKDLVDLVVGIAKMHEDFDKSPGSPGKKNGAPPKGDDENVSRMIKNSEKKPSSASIGGGRGGTVKSYDELTPEDALLMSDADYAKLPDKVRERLLQEAE